MKLNIVSTGKRQQVNAQVSIYSNGNFAFNKSAVEMLNFKQGDSRHIALATDETNPPEKNLYLILKAKQSDSTRKLLIVPNACSVNFSKALDALKMDYKKNKYTYLIDSETTYNGDRVIILTRK